MNDMSKKMKIWTDDQKRRYFLIPEENDIRVGTFELGTVTGDRWLVLEEDALAFETTEAEAREWLRAYASQVLDDAKQSFIDAFSSKKASWRERYEARARERREAGEKEDASDAFKTFLESISQAMENGAKRAGGASEKSESEKNS